MKLFPRRLQKALTGSNSANEEQLAHLCNINHTAFLNQLLSTTFDMPLTFQMLWFTMKVPVAMPLA